MTVRADERAVETDVFRIISRHEREFRAQEVRFLHTVFFVENTKKVFLYRLVFIVRRRYVRNVAKPNIQILAPDAFAERIEDEVERICKGVAGECAVDAVVSLSGGYRAVYASDYQSSGTGYKNSMVLVGSGSSEGAVLVCYENPQISGIGIVLSRPADERVKNDIISLVSAAFSVGTNKIYVAFGS